MASLLYNVACPQCGRVAVGDFHYTNNQKFCQFCGYDFSREEKCNEKHRKHHIEEGGMNYHKTYN